MNLTLDEVSAKTGFSKPYLSTIETGKVKNPPGDSLLQRLEVTLDFESGLLLHIAHLEGMPADIRHDFEAIDAENRKYRQIIRNIVHRRTDTAELKEMLSLEELDVDEQGQDIKAGQLVPVINKVSAGYPIDFDDLGYPVGIADDYVRCIDLHDPNAFAVRVVGDSMESRFFEGDIIVFSPAMQVDSGDDCFVRFTMPHETTFKRVFFESEDKVRLQPRNEKYPPKTIDLSRINGVYRAAIRLEKL